MRWKEEHMSAQQDNYPRMTVEEFFAFEEAHPEGRYEYIDGYIRDLHILMMAGGTKNHAVIAMNIGYALKNALRAHGKQCEVYSADVRLAVSSSKYVHPDVSVSCHQTDLDSNSDITSPSLVVEVLSPSTEGYDHIQKLEMYSAYPSIQEYLLVSAAKKQIKVYHRLPGDSMEYKVYEAGDTITLRGLGIDITVDDCYDGITFLSE